MRPHASVTPEQAAAGAAALAQRIASDPALAEIQRKRAALPVDEFKVQILDAVVEPIPPVKERFQSLHAKIYLLVFLFLVAIFIIRKFVIGKYAEKLLRYLSCRPCRAKSQHEEFQLTNEFLFLSHDFYKELEIPHLMALYKKSTRELKTYQ